MTRSAPVGLYWCQKKRLPSRVDERTGTLFQIAALIIATTAVVAAGPGVQWRKARGWSLAELAESR